MVSILLSDIPEKASLGVGRHVRAGTSRLHRMVAVEGSQEADGRRYKDSPRKGVLPSNRVTVAT